MYANHFSRPGKRMEIKSGVLETEWDEVWDFSKGAAGV